MSLACPLLAISSMISVMEVLPENDGVNNEYDIFKQDYASLEVTDENRAPQVEPPRSGHNKQRRRKILGTAALVLILLSSLFTGVLALIRASKKADTSVVINTQSLDNGTLNQLSAEAGDGAKQQL